MALYGIDFAQKTGGPLLNCGDGTMTDDVIRLRDLQQIDSRSLRAPRLWPRSTASDILQPARDGTRRCSGSTLAICTIKTQNGAAMSVGRIPTFLDICIQRDLVAGKIDEDPERRNSSTAVLKVPHGQIRAASPATTGWATRVVRSDNRL